jgi:transcription termination/antitermination protein NusG
MTAGTTTDAIGPRSAAGAPPASVAWYAVWTRSHCEAVVAQQLRAGGFETFLPEIGTWSQRGGATRVIRVPMFPGYLFVRAAIDKQRYVDLLKARGVVRVLGDAWNRLAAIPDTEIVAVQRLATADVPVLAHQHLSSGDRVVVTEGPLAGIEGIFVHSRADKGRLVLSVDLLGRSVAVDMDAASVVPSTRYRTFA